MKVSDLPVSVMCSDRLQVKAFWELGYSRLKDLASLSVMEGTELTSMLKLINTEHRMKHFIAVKNVLHKLTAGSALSIGLPALSVRATNLLESDGRLSVEGIILTDPDSLTRVSGWGATTIKELKESRGKLVHTVFDFSDVIFKDIPEELSSSLDLQSLSNNHVGSVIQLETYCRFGEAFSEQSRQFLVELERKKQQSDEQAAQLERSSKMFLDLVSDAVESIPEKENIRSIFLNRYGIADRSRFRTLEDLGQSSESLGFPKAVTRERVRQLEKRVGSKLLKLNKFDQYSLRTLFPKDSIVVSAHNFFKRLGFQFQDQQSISFPTFHSLLKYCGIPVDWVVKEIDGQDFILFDGSEQKLQMVNKSLPDRVGVLSLEAVAHDSELKVSDLREIISQIPSYSILTTPDDEDLVWKNVSLDANQPESSFSTGNQIYTTLLKIFALVKTVDIEVLSRVFPRVRDSAHTEPLNLKWLETIIDYLPDFETQGEVVVFNGFPDPKRVSKFDRLVAQLVLKVGQTITSGQIYPFMTSHGIPQSSTSALSNYCLFLVQSVRGVGYQQGRKRFITSPSEIRVEMLADSASQSQSIELKLNAMNISSGRINVEHFFPSDTYSVVAADTGEELGNLQIEPSLIKNAQKILQKISARPGETFKVSFVDEGLFEIERI